MPKLMFYCQHILGMGHLIRSIEIVRGLISDFQICFINGGQVIEELVSVDGGRLGHDLLEAMLAETAIVGTNVDAIGEIIEDGINGLLVNPYSSEELEIAIAKLISRPLLRQTLGKSAKQKVLQDLNPAIELDNWATVYHHVLSTSTKPQMTVVAG